MAVTADKAWITNAIQAAVREEIEKIIAEEAEAAHVRVGQRIKAMVDQIALSVMRHYDVSTIHDGIHIVVKKEI